MNKHQVEGRVKEMAGKTQAAVGHTLGNTSQEVKGRVNQAAGSAQATYGDAKEDIKDSINKDTTDLDRDETIDRRDRH